jgi:peptidoglycan hydrolase-like protein with peptidoglycan-binding domain
MPNAPLSVGAYSDDVSRLQSSLIQQGFKLPTSEVNRRFFGPATRQAVQQFQKSQGLPVTGAVDAATAAALAAGASGSAMQQTGGASAPPPTPVATPPRSASVPATIASTVTAPSKVPAQVSTPPTAAAVTIVVDQNLNLSEASLTQPVLQVLSTNSADKTTVNTLLNPALKAQLTSLLTGPQQTALLNLLQTLSPADFSADQNLSLRAFVAKHTTLPTDPTARQAAEAAIATLSTTTTVAALLALNSTVASNPIFTPIVARTNLTTLLSTSPSLSSPQLQTDFINAYANFTGSPQDFWTQLGQNAEFTNLVPELQFTMQLGVLTLDNPPLVTALRNAYKPASMRDLTKLDANALTSLISSGNIAVPDAVSGSTPAAQTTNYVNGIIGLLQAAFPTDYVAQGLAASKDPVQQSVATFLSNSPDFDFQTTAIDTYIQQNSAKAFQNIPSNQVSAVTTQLKSIQRVFRISPDYSTINTLLSAGLDSAAKIAKISRANFIQQYSSSLGGDPQALTVYTTASHINSQSVNLFRTIQSGITDVSPVSIAGQQPTVPAAIQNGIPDWQTLFGSTSACECDDCVSVYSPSAYFVDLLEYLRNSNANVAGFTPLDVLIGGTSGGTTTGGRRPDLPFIKLNCQDTNTPLPFIDLVNEILESYIVLGGKLDQTTAHSTPSDATADELSVNPEYTLNAAYTTLSGASYPLTLPYDRFLNVARRYLAFLGGNRLQVIQSFQTLQPPVDTASVIAVEVLGLNYMEFQLIAGWDYLTNKTAATPPLYALYGYSAASVTRTVSGTTITQPWEQWVAGVPEFMARTGLQFSDLVNLIETQFINPGQTITLQSAIPCDVTQTVITPLSDATLANILSFIRLWQKLGWSMSDLDTVLAVLAPNGINRGCLLALAEVQQLQSTLNLQLNQLVALWGHIDTDSRDSLYISLFQNKAVLNPVDANFQLAYRAALPAAPTGLPASVLPHISYDATNQQMVFAGAMTDDQWTDLIGWAGSDSAKLLAVQNLFQMRWAPGTELAAVTASTPPTITGETPTILAALRISADDLNAIRAATNLMDAAPPSTAQTPLNLLNLSQLYRYAILAQCLGLAVTDLISLIALTGINPFQLASTDPVTDQTAQFVTTAQTVVASRFSVAQLNFIYRAIANPAAGVGPLEGNVDLLVMTIQTGLQKVQAANAFTPDPNGKLLRQKLGVILDSSDLAAAMDLIGGTGVYTASLATLPSGVTFTGSLANLISYDATNQALTFNGPMTDAVQSQLLLLSNNPGYQAAVNNLWQQPRTILTNDLTFLNPADALTQLINSPSADVAGQYNYVLQILLSYLTDTQSRSLVKQSLSQALSLDSATISLLLAGDAGAATPALLTSQRDPTQPAIVDFVDAGDGGLLATYFSDTNLTVVIATQIDPTVNVGSAGESVGNPGGVSWAGKVLPQFSENYTFYVTANDGVRLWVNDQLVIDQWSNQALSTRASPSLNLNAGQLYDIQLDYYNASSTATAGLGWSSQSTSNNVNVPIPQTALFPANTFTTLFRLYPIALLLSTFAMKADEVAYLSAHGADFAGVDPGNSANTVNFDLTELPVNRSNAAAVDAQAVAFFNQWQKLNRLFTLRNALPQGNVSLFDVFRIATSSTNPAALGSSTIAAVLSATGWNANEFATLTGKTISGSVTVGFGLTDADFRNAEGQKGTGLVWLNSCLGLSGRLGISTSQLFLWGNNPPDAAQSQDIIGTVKAKYDEPTWVTVGAPLNNQIRDDSKNALIAYVLNMPSILNLGYTDADGLYEYFLIDVQMTSCMMTSRIVQATAAVQLFIQRCLLNLENDNTGVNAVFNVSADAIDANQWQWRQNYRVWEANREVFLYPENYIDPTLRDNRTPFFEDLQTELQQGPVTADSAEQAFQNYLKSVQEVARLEICGLFWEYDTDTATSTTHNIFHVFGRTYASPHVYYYRTFDNSVNVWSPWEQVTADIEGDHLVPVIWNRRLHLFWPLFKEQTTPTTAAGGPDNLTVPAVSSTPSQSSASTPVKSLQIQFAWSEYRDGAWTKKQVTVDTLTPDGFSNYTGEFDPSSLSFQATTNGAGLTITTYCWGPYGGDSGWNDLNPFPTITANIMLCELPNSTVTLTEVLGNPPQYSLFNVGQFIFDGCSSVPQIATNGMPGEDTVPFETPVNTLFDYMYLDSNHGQTPFPVDFAGGNQLILVTPGHSGSQYYWTNVPVLSDTPTAYSLSFPQQFYPYLDMQVPSPFNWQPFFYADNSRTYFVTQETVQISTIVRDPVNSVVGVTPVELSSTANLSSLPRLPILEQQPTTLLAANVVPAGADLVVPAPEAQPSVAAAVAGDISLAGGPTLIFNDWQNYYSRTVTYVNFATHRHPHICDFLKSLNWQGVPGLLTLANQQLDAGDVAPNTIFQQTYKPTSVVGPPFPSEDVDFSPSGAYSIYNWEIFFHIPFLIATQLSQNQQFDDAETYFRYIFVPTSNSTDPIPSRYWNVLPFYQETEPDRIEDLVTALQYTGADPNLLQEKADFSAQITQWEQNPFDPDLIARMRIVAYQKAVVMQYIDDHLSWGDQLYAQFTRESVNEATLHYVLCSELLGDKPVILPPQGVVLDETYNQLVTSSPGLDSFSDVLVTMENLFPFSTAGSSSNSDGSGPGAASSVALVPYFCIPPNDTLLGYWDTVAQRLFQIRHCMNISGQVQQLPLFAPPINPALLIQALAMGMDLSSALSDINAATPYYRFAYMYPKAVELCAEVRALGASLLAALEKSDAEALAMLRATQETGLMQAVLNVKQQQLAEANSNLAALNDSLLVAQNRQQYYQGLIAAGQSSYEQSQISLLNQAQQYQTSSQTAQMLGAELSLYPNIEVGLTGVGGSPTATLSFGGAQLAAVANFVADGFAMMASLSSSSANITGIQGGWSRRSQEWAFQQQSATLDIAQINDQIKAGTAHVAYAQADLDNQNLQISNASDVEDFLRTKYTNQALYDWMVSQVSAVYFQCYQMAYDLAKRAEACFVFERMPDPANYVPFIQFGYWDSLRKGLISGERLYQDLKRLEIAYMDQNQRDFEITKSVSLLLLDPVALINLKETGQCTVQLPEALFDIDYPGHYLRRIKSLSMTIPCVVGPYTSVNCTLTLASNKIRIDNTAANSKDYVKDSHFAINFAATQSIATSTAQNDSGLFTVNFNDERYLPFEGAGVISIWQLSMPQDTNAFDFETITDVIFNLKYTARDGGASLRSVARSAALLPAVSSPGASPIWLTALPSQKNLARIFSLCHEFPSDWYNFLNPLASSPDQSMTLNLTQERFPFRYRGKKIQIYEIDIFLIFRGIYNPTTYTANGTPLGDYAAKGSGGALKLSATAPGGGTPMTTQLVSNSVLLNGVPYGTIPQTPPPPAPPTPPSLGPSGAWTLVAKGTDIQNIATSLQQQVTSGSSTFYRIDPAVVKDVFLVCHYSAG